jgi:hypothetical protein
MSKTNQFLRVLHHVSHSPTRCLSMEKLQELLDHPPKSTWHRLLSELLNGSAEAPALLIETRDEETDEKLYCLNVKGWQSFMDAHEEGRFLLECYRQIGYLLDSNFTKMVFDLPDLNKKLINRLERKFMNLVKIKAHSSPRSKGILNSLIESLVQEKQLEITYDGGLRTIRPLTLCQHRDDLYIMCYRMKEDSQWEQRTYKVSRISGIRVLDRKFPYPGKGEWNPEKEYQHSSGLVLGEVRRVQIRIYGDSRKTWEEKSFFGGELINRDQDFDTYLCTYTNSHEFLGQLFVYAQDVEIVDDHELHEQFVSKAEMALKRNNKRVA